MRQSVRLAELRWLLRGGSPPGSSCADGRRLYRIEGRSVRIALALKGGDPVADFQVEPVERAARVKVEVWGLRADLSALWEQVPALFRPVVKARADAVFSRLDELERLTGAK